jgi:hypothetical protein
MLAASQMNESKTSRPRRAGTGNTGRRGAMSRNGGGMSALRVAGIVILITGLALAAGATSTAVARPGQLVSDGAVGSQPGHVRSAPSLPPWRAFVIRTTRIVAHVPRVPRTTLPRPARVVTSRPRRVVGLLHTIATKRPAGLAHVCMHAAIRQAQRSLPARDYEKFLDSVTSLIPYVGFSVGTMKLVSELSDGQLGALMEAWCL